MSPLSVLCICLIFGVGSVAHTNLLSDHRIVGGEEVDISSHPHQLTFQYTGIHVCGASIISRKWAVTAAHCVGNNPSLYTLGAGSRDKYNTTYHKVARVIGHPQYNLMEKSYDVALLELENEFTYGVNVQPIKLADRELEHGELVNITGWGDTKEGSGLSSQLLMKVTMPIIKRDICAEAYKPLDYSVTQQMICAGYLGEGGKDSCQGDSGGPLTANGFLYGIVSWGEGCARPEYPSVYSNVANLRPWITSHTGI